jgi:hypothetical protein
VFDLNTFIVETVKDKSPAWFNNNLNVDLVEDYYTNTLVYDKKHGDVIRLKCVGDDNVLQQLIMQKANVTIGFDNLRFYKQKFILECHIESVEQVEYVSEPGLNDVEDECEEDVPCPSEEDIKEIKEECLEGTNKRLIDLKTELHKLEYKIQNIEQLKNELINSFHIDEVIKLCNDLENICE